MKDLGFFGDIICAALLLFGIAIFVLVQQSVQLTLLANSAVSFENIGYQVDALLEKTRIDPDQYSIDISRKSRTVDVQVEGEEIDFGPRLTEGNVIKFVQVTDLSEEEALNVPFFFYYVECSVSEGDSLFEAKFAFAPSGEMLFYNVAPNLLLPAELDTTTMSIDSVISDFAQTGNWTSSLFPDFEMKERSITMRANMQEFTFLYEPVQEKYPGYSERVSIKTLGNRVIFYMHRTTVEDVSLNVEGDSGGSVRVTMPEESENRFNVIMGMILGGLQVVCWLGIIVVIIVYFILKMRRDELDLGRTLIFAIITSLLMTLFIGAESDDLVDMLIGGVLGGVFVGAALSIAYSTGESLTREVWNDKLRVFDTLLTKNILIREAGVSVQTGFGVAGILIILAGLGEYSTEFIASAYRDFPNGFFTESYFRIAAKIGSSSMLWVLATFSAVFLIVPPFLHMKIKKPKVVGILTAVIFVITSGNTLNVEPDHIRLAASIPAAVFAAYCVFRFDTSAIFVALATLSVATMSVELGVLRPDVPLATKSVPFLILFLLFITSSVVRRRGSGIESVDTFIPDYIVRHAEKERILRELEIARKFQMELLPGATPDYSAVSIGAMCIPATEVGGDYYDYFPYDTDKLGIIIGDVSGKGVPAAFSMTMVKGIVKTLAEIHRSPRDILSNFNKIFSVNAAKGVFISSIYAVFDFDSMELHFSRAGHVPLIVWKRSTGEISQFVPGGIAVGLDEGRIFDTSIEEQRLQMEAGDIFVFYTDGISEASNARGEEFGEERLEVIIKQYSDRHPQEILDIIYKKVELFSGNQGYRDDITAVAVKVK